MAELRWATGTHEGQVREVNEDAAFANRHLFVVADGMGGHLAGEVASAIAIETLDQHLDANGGNSLDDLVSAITLANQIIFGDANENPDHSGMGTTITAIAVITDRFEGEALGVANVGDSRIYLFRHGRLRQVTIDHSFVQELIAEGAISRDEARHHPRRNIVTRGLGIESAVRVDSWTVPLIRGDRFLLCSDGLSDYVTEDVIGEVLARHPDDPAPAVIELIDHANAAGGPDNITVVIVDVLDGDDPPDPTEEIDVVPAWFEEDDDVTEDTLIVADALPADDDVTGEVPVTAQSSDHNEQNPNETDDSADAATAPGDADHPAEQATDTDRDATTETTLPAPTAPVSPPPTTRKQRRAAKHAATPSTRSRGARIVQLLFLIGVAAVVIGGFAVLAGWARSGYFVAFDRQGEVLIYRGHKGGVLWFEPTVAGRSEYTRDELDQRSIERVDEEPTFSSLANAERFITEQLTAKAPDADAPANAPPAAPTTTAPPSTNSTESAPSVSAGG